MPYIVTHIHRRQLDSGGSTANEVLSRRAFASLEDAREHAWTTIHQIDASRVSLSATRMKWALLPETGGTVELPDGTILEVERAATLDVGLDAGLSLDEYCMLSDRSIIEAFNAKQAA